MIHTRAQELRTPWLTMHRSAGAVRLRGEVDLSNAGLVERVLACTVRIRGDGDHAPAGGAALVVDLSELDFLDVTGHRALRRGTQHWRATGGTVLLTGAGGAVLRVLELVGLGVGGDVRLG